VPYISESAYQAAAKNYSEAAETKQIENGVK
jgi:hypothetical protein